MSIGVMVGKMDMMMKMILKYINTALIIPALLLSSASLAGQLLDGRTLEMLHTTSADIVAHSDRKAVEQSLYKQMRPIASVTREDATPSEIDAQVWKYVQTYSIRLIENYDYLYNELIQAEAEFSSCSNPQPIRTDTDIIRSLCVDVIHGKSRLKYMKLSDMNTWKELVSFDFIESSDRLIMKEINVPFSKDQKVYVGEI